MASALAFLNDGFCAFCETFFGAHECEDGDVHTDALLREISPQGRDGRVEGLLMGWLCFRSSRIDIRVCLSEAVIMGCFQGFICSMPLKYQERCFLKVLILVSPYCARCMPRCCLATLILWVNDTSNGVSPARDCSIWAKIHGLPRPPRAMRTPSQSVWSIAAK